MKYYTESLINHDKEANGAKLCNHPGNKGFKLEPWEKCPTCKPKPECTNKPDCKCEKCKPSAPKCKGSGCTPQGTEHESIIPFTPGYPDSDAIDTLGLQQNSKSQQPNSKQLASHEQKPASTTDPAAKVASNLQQTRQSHDAAMQTDLVANNNPTTDAEGQEDGQQVSKSGHWWDRLKNWFHRTSGRGGTADEASVDSASNSPAEEANDQQEGQPQNKGGHWWDRLKLPFSSSSDDSQPAEDSAAGQEMERNTLTRLPEDAM